MQVYKYNRNVVRALFDNSREMPVPIQRDSNRFYEDIIENIKAMIVSGELAQGEKLPSERELAEYFNVSRIPVREALKILEYMGVLYNVRGEGMYVKNVGISEIINKMNFAFSATTHTMTDFIEVREALDTTAAYYAALRRTDEDIARMQRALDTMEEVSRPAEKETEEMIAASHEFHNGLVAAAHNSVLSGLYDNLFELLDISKQLSVASRSCDDHSRAEHCEIFKKILLKDADGARKAMVQHLDKAKGKIKRRLEEKNNVD